MNIAITGPDILLSDGGAQRHTINISRILKKYYNIVYLPDPALMKKYKKNIKNIKTKIENLEEHIKIIDSFKEIIEKNYTYDEILEMYAKENFDFIYDFEFINNGIFPDIFALTLSKKMKKSMGTGVQGLGDFNLHFKPYAYSTLKLSKNPKIFSYRVYHYINRNILLEKLNSCKNIKFAIISNNNYFENVNIKLRNLEVLDPASGITDGDLDITKFKKDKEENKIVFFSRLIYNKGIFDIPYILKILKDEYNGDFKFTLIGKFSHDDEKKIFFKMLEKYGLKDNVEYLGYLSNEDLYGEVSSAKLMIYPSHSDSFSIAVSQALLLGTPVIAYNIAGLKGYGSFNAVKLVEEFDYSSMAREAIKMLKNNNDDLFDENVKSFLRKHTWQNVAIAYKNIFEKYLGI